MKTINKIIIYCIISLLLFLTCFTSLSVTSVSAQSLYLRVITEDTPFFSSEHETQPLFYLTYSYYVKVLGYGKNFTHVEIFGSEYAAIDGYVPNDTLFSDDLEVSSPYPSAKIKTAKTTLIYSDSNLTSPIQYVFTDRELNYYGKLSFSNKENLYYVGYNDKLGYVKESDLLPFEIALHPNELTFIVEPEPLPDTTPTPDTPSTETPTPDDNQPSTPDNSTDTQTLRWVVIGCLILAGLITLILTITKRPAKTKILPDYYEESDLE